MVTICPECGHRWNEFGEYDFIITEIRRAYRDMGGRVFPKNVAPIVGYSEYHTREIMRKLAATGKLRRIGQRGGYALAEAI